MSEQKIDWRDYLTDWPIDLEPIRQRDNYERGVKVGENALEFHIAVNGVWSTTNKPNKLGASSTFSYEMLGYHAGTAHFLKGVLASGVEIVDHRPAGTMNKFDRLPSRVL